MIEVPGFDISACGGTHVARTGAIGNIAVASSERFRGGTRVEFLCGVRALKGHRALRDAVAASVRLVSVLPSELPVGIERLQLKEGFNRQIGICSHGLRFGAPPCRQRPGMAACMSWPS